MPTTLTPEHMQLLSDQKLDKTAKRKPSEHDDADTQRKDRVVARAARYELSRRRGEVPVSDRYGC